MTKSAHARIRLPPTVNRSVSIVGTGSYLPARVLTNADLEKIVDTTDEWIQVRTGIQERRIAADDEATSDLAAAASRAALEAAGVAAADVDMIVVATVTPDHLFPSTACLVQDRIGARKAFCFDLEAACSGFLYGLEIGRHFVGAGTLETVLVIGAEKLSAVTDWEDRATCVLFGDGAGAAVLQARGDAHGLMGGTMGSDGSLAELLTIPGGGSRRPASAETVRERLHFMKMNGREVFKHAVRCMADAGLQALERCGLRIGDVDWVIPHQANHRIIRAVADRLRVPIEQFYLNLERCGNISAASVPVALDEAARAGKLRPRDIVLLIAFGGGFTWGASVLEW